MILDRCVEYDPVTLDDDVPWEVEPMEPPDDQWTVEPYDPDRDDPPPDHHHQGDDPPDPA